MKTKIALLDTKTKKAQNLSQLLNDDINYSCVGMWHNPNDFLLDHNFSMPDLLITEIRLINNLCIIDSIKHIKESFPNLKIIVLTHCTDREAVQKTMNIGIHGFLYKEINSIQLFDAINDTLNNDFPMSSQVAKKFVEIYESMCISNKYAKKAQSILNKLPIRQREIIEKLDKGYSYKRIAEELGISIDTVRYHIKNLYERFNVNSKIELIKHVYKERL